MPLLHTFRSRGFRGRQAVRPAAEIYPRGFHSDARFIADPCVLIVNDQTPYCTLKEFADDAMKRPNETSSRRRLYGALHLPMALYLRRQGSPRHLPTNGGGPGSRHLSVQFQALVSSIAACLGQIKGGKARALAHGAQRSHALPDVPTMKELGYDIEFYPWVGLFAPKGTLSHCDQDPRLHARSCHDCQVQGADGEHRPGRRLSRSGRVPRLWDADAKRVEDAVRSIGRVEG